jgi:hypothetical protein
MRKFSHECSKTNASVLQFGRPDELYGEAYRMDAHAPLAGPGFCIQSIDREHDFFNRSTCKFIAKNVD